MLCCVNVAVPTCFKFYLLSDSLPRNKDGDKDLSESNCCDIIAESLKSKKSVGQLIRNVLFQCINQKVFKLFRVMIKVACKFVTKQKFTSVMVEHPRS